jgi:hypothetical protein
MLAALIVAGAGWAGAAHAAVEVETRLSRSQLSVGESTTLDVVVRGASGGIGEPEFEVTPGLEILGSSRQQSFSWVNGRSSSETVFRYDLAPDVTGTLTIGPFRVRVGGRTYEARAATLEVSAAPTRIGPSGSGPAELRVEVEPTRPYVGQPVLLRVRLVQRASLAEDPRYSPPATPGFWGEEASRPESYYADEGGRRVLVTETRTRLYPIAVGRTTVGEATASLALVGQGGATDPLQWLRGQVQRREVTLRSRPVEVEVRALPRGAPVGFDGAVGALTATWCADRDETRADVPVTLRLDVRGIGNLPLIQAPPLAGDAVEIFSGTVHDSMPAAGQLSAGRRRFVWTALPRREGRLRLPPPAFAWFDPARGAYVTLAGPEVALDVGPALPGAAAAETGLPHELGERALDPFRRPALPWAWALGGLALGAALALWRRSGRPDPDAMERARQREWLRVVGLAKGPDFWRAAEEATAWVQSRGGAVAHLRREIAAARFGGSSANTESVRRRVVDLLGGALPPARPRWPLRLTAGLLAGGAIVLCALTGPRGGPAASVVRATAADRAAAEERTDEARRDWLSMWREGARAPELAARIAWSHARAGEIGPAALWVLRGEAAGGRQPSLAWVREQVREGGGLAGEDPAHLPITPFEWALAALLAGVAAGAFAGRRPLASAALAAALGCALVRPVESAWQARSPRGILRETTPLEGPGLELEAGHVVRVLDSRGGVLRVSAGHGVEGTLPADRVALLEGSS